MAYYAALISLAQLLDEIIHERYPNFLLDKQQIESVYEKLRLLQGLLEDYSPRDEEAAYWLERRIRNAAYQAQDIIESQISNQIHSKDKPHQVDALISASQKLMSPQLHLEKVKEEVDSIVEEVMRIEKSHTTEDLQVNYYSADTGTPKQAPSGSNDMMGFDEYLTIIKAQLCGESSKLQVVSIVGMGGIGKTTLARNIFNDKLIVYHFYCRAWVTVSQDYRVRKILQGIIDSLNINNKELSGVGKDVLAEHIYKHLKGKRYLIIMDDVWDTKVWDGIKRLLPDDSNGSRIIITTRQSDVAIYTTSCRLLNQMQFLNEEQSWCLREKLFAQEQCPKELGDIGRLIAKNCRGLPLAIVVVAGLVSKVNKTQYDWEEIARNVNSAAKNDENFSKILSLSYNHLPHHLKPCFLYIGGFPEDHEIHVSKLIKLWVAEGFLQPIESKSLEEVAEEYLEDLVKRNLVLITKKRSNGKFKCCSIHDVLRDLCTQRAHYENFLHVMDNKDVFSLEAIRFVRQLYITHDHYIYVAPDEQNTHIRSILCFHGFFISFGQSFQFLRVLDILKIMFSRFPLALLKLFLLRYLALADSVLPIPQSLTELQNLETLIISSSVLFESTSDISSVSQIWEMPHLRHVMISRIRLSPVPSLPDEASILKNLQTLSRVENFTFTHNAIAMIPNLQKLRVIYTCEPMETWQNFGLDNLVHLHHLETLDILISGNVRKLQGGPFPESFAFPMKLKKLSLAGCRLPWKDLTKVGSLPNLEVLKLRYDAFVGEKWEAIEGEFPRLKFLLIKTLNLKYWQAENTHFPCLEHLDIRYCSELKEIPPEIGHIPTLEVIEVHYSKFAAVSALKLQEEQRDLGNDFIEVRLFPQD